MFYSGLSLIQVLFVAALLVPKFARAATRTMTEARNGCQCIASSGVGDILRPLGMPGTFRAGQGRVASISSLQYPKLPTVACLVCWQPWPALAVPGILSGREG